MSKNKTDCCKISLERSKKTLSSVLCTLNVPNIFPVPKYEAFFCIKSQSFQFANATWYFLFTTEFDPEIEDEDSDDDDDVVEFYMKRLKSEIPKQDIFCKAILCNADHEIENKFTRTHTFEKDREEIFVGVLFSKLQKSLYDKPLTIYIRLFCDEMTELEANCIPFESLRDVEVLSQDFKKFWLNGKNCDLTLKVADKEFRVHQDVLMARSEVFEAMLSHRMIEKERGVIDVPDCDPRAMEELLLYVYTGKVETLDKDNALGLYYAADKYNLLLLKEKCRDFMKVTLSPAIICDVIQLALNHCDSDLLECATEYFLHHTSDIFSTLQWMSFMKLNSTTANELLIKASKKWDCAKS